MKSYVTFSLASAAAAAGASSLASAFTIHPLPSTRTLTTHVLRESPIVSPFDNSDDSAAAGDPVATLPDDLSKKGPLELTWDNVELVLDEMRPFLIQDGGNVAITDIDGPVVLLELQGACGTCPSSTVRRNYRDGWMDGWSTPHRIREEYMRNPRVY